MVALIGTLAAAAWQDENYGPQMKQYARVAIEQAEAMTDEGTAGRKLVDAAKSKLEL